MAGFTGDWWVAGGRALEAWTGVTREHDDLDLGILRADLPLLRRHVAERYHVWAAFTGALRPVWPSDADDLPEGCGQVWLRPDARSPWEYDVLLNPGEPGQWVNRRWPGMSLPLAEATWARDGVRYLQPEIVLLFKARHLRDKDRRRLRRRPAAAGGAATGVAAPGAPAGAPGARVARRARLRAAPRLVRCPVPPSTSTTRRPRRCSPQAIDGDGGAAGASSATPRRCTPRAVARAGWSRSPARRSPRRSARGPREVVFTSGGTESDNLAVKGLFWARRDADPRRTRLLVSAVEHHAVLDCVDLLVAHEGAEVDLARGRRARPRRARTAARGRSSPTRTSVALVTVMWANNEVGTVQPVADIAARRARARRPGAHRRRPGRRPAAGRLRRQRCRPADAQRPQDRRPARRRRARRPARRHPGAADPRRRPGAPACARGTLDTPAIAAFAVAARPQRRRAGGRGVARLRGAARPAGRSASASSPRSPSGDWRAGDACTACPATRTCSSPAATATPCSTCSTRPAWSARTGSACQAGVPQPSHVLLAMGVARAARPRRAAVHPRPHVHRRGRRRLPGRAAGRPSSAPAAPQAASSVADERPDARRRRDERRGRLRGRRRARMLDAGHEVVGVHLALSASRRPRCARRPRLLHDRGRRRRPPGRRRARASRSTCGTWPSGSSATSSRTSSPSTPRAAPPTRACAATRRSSSPRCSTRRVALGFDAVATGHYAQVVEAPDGRASCTGPSTRPRTSPTSSACSTTEPARARPSSPSATPPSRRSARRPRERGFYVADKPDSHDICFIADGDTRGWLASRLGEAPGDIVDSDGDRPRRARRRLRVHRRPAQGLCASAGPPRTARPATSCEVRATDQHGRRRHGRPARRRRPHR